MTQDGRKVAQGIKIQNNLYKLSNIMVRKPEPTHKMSNTQSYNMWEPAKTWEIWHRRFGHVGMTSLQQMLDEKLVEGFNVDIQSPKYDCEACVQAKHF